MLTVRFFSLIREALDCEQLEVAHHSELQTVGDLKRSLANTGGEQWREALYQPNVVHALNQRVVNTDHVLQNGDEVAFFPPMTGG
ncbi:MoaD/ThiS family protein [Luminiphilus sp.]|jgi:sulfur-carrier protein|nr:MoaD/ThiS family protein [Luminiphilus sp.]MDB4582505.1 MoaD/ThiS family protein [Draconibacterium sp.]MDA9848058.1 MoaD/ThiS family protein [Luminiphilus sp.]MDB2352392.1 MoaD/ThiS family protein [Luminiphilus sp.]MDB2615664.1 MoaD/ThiS family protein [Luminiphilus sp.]